MNVSKKHWDEMYLAVEAASRVLESQPIECAFCHRASSCDGNGKDMVMIHDKDQWMYLCNCCAMTIHTAFHLHNINEHPHDFDVKVTRIPDLPTMHQWWEKERRR